MRSERGESAALSSALRVLRALVRRLEARAPTSVTDVRVDQGQVAHYMSGLKMGTRPTLSLLARDPTSAFAFLYDHRRRAMGSEASAVPGTDDLRDTVATVSWYHTIQLRDDVVTPGVYDHRDLVPHYGIPADLRGRRALDIGTSDGFWAFEFERRGAEVTAVDVESSRDLDFPPSAREFADADLPLERGDGFRLAHEVLDSHVRYLPTSVYDLDGGQVGLFDLVHIGDVLLHLERPIEALRRARRLLADGGMAIISDVVDPELPGREGESFMVRYHGGWNTMTWWTPSIDALGQMMVDAGFSDVSIRALYMLPPRGATSGPWRAVMHATA